MKKLFAKAQQQAADVQAAEDVSDEEDGSLIDFFVPVLVVVGIMLATSDLVVSVIIAIAICFVLYVPRKKMSFDEFFKTFYEGVHSMIDILIILLLVFVFVDGLNGIGISEYVVTIAEPILVGAAIPVLSFIIVALLAFGGVEYWAVMLLMAPIALPLADVFSISPYLTMAAIVSGAVCGGTSCFLGEQLLMCGQAVERKSTEMGMAGLPYSIIAFVGTAIIYVILGITM